MFTLNAFLLKRLFERSQPAGPHPAARRKRRAGGRVLNVWEGQLQQTCSDSESPLRRRREEGSVLEAAWQ